MTHRKWEHGRWKDIKPTPEQISAQALVDRGIPQGTAETIARKVHAHDDLVAHVAELRGLLRSALECIEQNVPATTFAPRERIRAELEKEG